MWPVSPVTQTDYAIDAGLRETAPVWAFRGEKVWQAKALEDRLNERDPTSAKQYDVEADARAEAWRTSLFHTGFVRALGAETHSWANDWEPGGIPGAAP